MLQLACFTILVSAIATLIAVALAIALGFWIETRQKKIGRPVLIASQALNATPPTVVGIFFYYVCLKFPPLSGMLYTPYGMIVGQIILGLPIAYFLFVQVLVKSLTKIDLLGACSINGSKRFYIFNLLSTVLADIRSNIVPTSFIVFGRLVGEVGAILIIGGGIHGKTDTLSTNIVMQTQMGDIETALTSGFVLLSIVVVARLIIVFFEPKNGL